MCNKGFIEQNQNQLVHILHRQLQLACLSQILKLWSYKFNIFCNVWNSTSNYFPFPKALDVMCADCPLPLSCHRYYLAHGSNAVAIWPPVHSSWVMRPFHLHWHQYQYNILRKVQEWQKKNIWMHPFTILWPCLTRYIQPPLQNEELCIFQKHEFQ
jgi:hypothetical protein